VASIGYELQLFKNVTVKIINAVIKNFFIDFLRSVKNNYTNYSKIQKTSKKIP